MWVSTWPPCTEKCKGGRSIWSGGETVWSPNAAHTCARPLDGNPHVKRTAHWQGLLPVFILAAGVHALAASNFFYTHDGYSAFETGERILRGELWLHDNVLRLLPTLSFAPRAHFGMDFLCVFLAIGIEFGDVWCRSHVQHFMVQNG